MSDGLSLAREMAALTAVMPRSMAETEARPPLNLPIGVRAAARMTTSYHKVRRYKGRMEHLADSRT